MLDIFLFLLVLPPLVLTVVFTVEVLAGIPLPRPPLFPAAAFPASVVVVPAHDEAAGLDAMLSSLLKAVEGQAAILVIADNCSDDTAAIARRRDVQVIERDDPANRGKGFALAAARRHLAVDPPEIVVVMDADCHTDAESFRALVMQVAAIDRAVQATNLLEPDLGAAVPVQFSNFAFLVRNRYRQIGLYRLSGGVNLTGTGMALPWRIFGQARLASAELVEDLALGLDLAAAGEPAQPAPHSLVLSRAGSAAATLTQRQRWEGGYLSIVRRHGPTMFAQAIRMRGRGGTAWRAFSFVIPPFSILLAVDGVLVAALAVAGQFSAATIALAAASVLTVAALAGLWAGAGRRYLSFGSILRLPLFVLWKVLLYRRLGRGLPSHWVRTSRS